MMNHQLSIINIFIFLLTMTDNVWTQTQTQSQDPQITTVGGVTIHTYAQCPNSYDALEKRIAELERRMNAQQTFLLHAYSSPTSPFTSNANDLLPTQENIRDCSDVFARGDSTDGIYDISPPGIEPFPVYCEFNTDDDGPWTVIQSRRNGIVDFQRNWVEYKNGFGSLNENFWLGLDRIHALTRQRQYLIRFELGDWDMKNYTANYRDFQVGPESTKYLLTISQYSGTLGDALVPYHNYAKFSTFDQDNDDKVEENCAQEHGGGWWYNGCDHANLNGLYHRTPYLVGQVDTGIEWDTFREKYSFKTTKMKLRPTFFQ